MSNSDYNKIISTINSVSRDYTYSPDPNNLICIDTSNNRIGINTLDPSESLHISGGSIRIGGDISASGDLRVNNIYANVISATVYGSTVSGSSIISTDLVNATNINATNTLDISRGRIIATFIDVSSTLDISRGRIRANFIDVSSTLDISRGRIIANFIDISSTLDISRGRIIANFIDVSSTLDISRGRIIANNIDISSTLDISRGRIIANYIDVSSTLDISRGRIIANNIDVSSTIDISRGRIIANYIDISSVLDISRGRIIANYIDISSILDISRGRIIANYIDVSSTIDISRGRIIANYIDISSTLDISRGRILANYIDISSVLDISRGRIIANNIDVSSVLDISRGRIIANNIDVSSTLDISRGRIIANNIDVSSTLDISRGLIRANNIDVSSTLDISRGRIIANNIDVSSIVVSSTLDISKGRILANTISGSAITINLNANASNSDIITINIGSSNGVNIITTTNSNTNAITINGVRLATTQHIKNVIPYGVIMAYYSTPAPPGWAICDGTYPTPDLRGKFILGGGINAGGTGGIISSDDTFIYHTFLTSGTFIPTDISSVNLIVVGGGGGGSRGNNTVLQLNTGGRGGSVQTRANHDVSIDTSYTITVGPGGEPYNAGQTSSFGAINANGGSTNQTENNVSDGSVFNIFNSTYYMGGDGGGAYAAGVSQANGGKGGGGGGGGYTNGLGWYALNSAGKGGIEGFNFGGDGVLGQGGNGGPNTGGGGGGVFYNYQGTPGSGGSGIVIVYYPHTSVGSNGINRLTPRPIGVSGGEENVTLNINNIPSHNHNYNYNYTTGTTGNATAAHVGDFATVFNGITSTIGIGRPHNNMPPFYVLIYIMKTSDYDFCYNLVATVPSAPNFTAVQSGLTSVIVNWSVPSNNGGSAINYYSIFMNDINQTNPSASTFTYTKTGLTSGQPYVFKVTATNTQGTSLSISPISITIANVPAAPTLTRGITEGSGFYNEQTASYEFYNVTVNWSTPSNGGSPITAYIMYINSILYETLPALSTFKTVPFPGYTTSSITMKAQNVAGLSTFSNTLTVTVP